MGKLLIALLVLIGLIAIVITGGYFAMRRPDISYDTLAAKYETSASRYVDLPGGVRMHYHDEGAPGAPTVLLLHGFSASLHTWSPWVERLGDRYHLVSVDLPGHGLTRAPAGYQASIEALRDAVHAFVDAQHLTDFALVGNSMGGNVAWEYALAYPQDLRALVLVDASGWPHTEAEAQKEPAVFALLRNPMARPFLTQLDNTAMFRSGLAASFADDSLVTDAMISRYAELSRAPGHREILLQLTLGFNDRNYATAERLAALRLPTLILTGDQDELVPPAHAEQFHQAIAGAQLVTFEGVGHIPQEEAPDASAAALNEFLYAAFAPAAAAPAQ